MGNTRLSHSLASLISCDIEVSAPDKSCNSEHLWIRPLVCYIQTPVACSHRLIQILYNDPKICPPLLIDYYSCGLVCFVFLCVKLGPNRSELHVRPYADSSYSCGFNHCERGYWFAIGRRAWVQLYVKDLSPFMCSSSSHWFHSGRCTHQIWRRLQ